MLNMINDILEFEYGYDSPALQKGVLTGIMMFGATIGSVLSGPLVKLGGRKGLVVSDAIAIIGTLLFIAKNYYACVVGRFICGLSVGIYSSLCPAYIASLSPK